MYLSRVQVDLNNRKKTQDLTHLGAFHNWVEQSFPNTMAKGVQTRHLWRLDTIANKQYLLILSDERPNLAQLEYYGVTGTGMTKEYDALMSRLTAGQQLRFRITANPTHSVSQPGGKRGRVYPHVKVEQQREWLLNKAERNGFKIVNSNDDHLQFDIVSRDFPVLHRRDTRTIRLSRVSFEGILEIENLELFKHMLVTGLGREKAFGMGLMTVIPVS